MSTSTAFLTDKYEITMLQAALGSGTAHQRATFDLFARKLPEGRRYGVVGGINRAIEAVRNFSFTEEQLALLAADPVILPTTVEYLRNYKFTGKITGYREGDLYFPNSPILTVEGNFGDAVLLETVLLSILNHDSAVMGAASRMVVAAEGLPLIEMGSRRTHEAAAVDSSRAAYIAGFDATSNMEAGLRYGVPTTGTSAHAFTLAFADEKDAFRAQVDALGTSTTLLVDTYDIPQGIRNAVEIAGTELGGIRIDSGDLHDETVNARKLLDELGAHKTKIVLSSDIDEYTISELLERGTPVDGVGAGTRVVTGSGHPTASMVFKLVEREDENGNMIPVAKKASGKGSLGGRKFAYRGYNTAGEIIREFFTTKEIAPSDISYGLIAPLQVTYVEDGSYMTHSVEEARLFHKHALRTLPKDAKRTLAGTAAFEAFAL
jgi:nicotinate phosphoribosyltransferase